MSDLGVNKFAARQHALVTWAQALAVGWTPERIRWRVRAGDWEPVQLGVFRLTGAPRTYEQALLAACIAIGPVVAASHRAAAQLHGLLSFSAPKFEITTTRDRSPELRGAVVVHRLADLLPMWVSQVRDVPTTSVARTLVDLGAVCSPATVEAAFDRAIGRRLVTTTEVAGIVRAVARQGRRGVGAARRALAARGSEPPAGVFEARMLTLLRRAGLPDPASEYEVRDERGTFVARVDFAYPAIKLAIEVDGYEPHVALDTFKHDRSRQNRIVSLGWMLLRYTWAEVDALAPHVGDGIARELARRATVERSQLRGFSAR